ncbi:hypothetical protein BU15DRAFT_66326 [Melanogaster broomeanus]|nr:hypothetical protein BU15DRAFT_66326 [Melanogaster broomeanus]
MSDNSEILDAGRQQQIVVLDGEDVPDAPPTPPAHHPSEVDEDSNASAVIGHDEDAAVVRDVRVLEEHAVYEQRCPEQSAAYGSTPGWLIGGESCAELSHGFEAVRKM